MQNRSRTVRLRAAGKSRGDAMEMNDPVPEAVARAGAARCYDGRQWKRLAQHGEARCPPALVKGAHRVVEKCPAGRAYQQAREGDQLLLIERQVPIPSRDPVEVGKEMTEPNRLHDLVNSGARDREDASRVAHDIPQRARRHVGTLRQEHGVFTRRHLDAASASMPQASQGQEECALACASVAQDQDMLAWLDDDWRTLEDGMSAGQFQLEFLDNEA